MFEETCLQFKMNKYFIKTRKNLSKPKSKRLFISIKQFRITTQLFENIINFEILVEGIKIMPVESYSN